MTKLEVLKQLADPNVKLTDKEGIPVSLGQTKIEIASTPKLLALVSLMVELEQKRPFAKWKKGYREVKREVEFYSEYTLGRWTDLLVKNINAGEWILSPLNGLEELENDRRKLQH